MTFTQSRVWSTWTPFGNDELNCSIYEERRQLLNRWYSRWRDEQKSAVLSTILALSSDKQLQMCSDLCQSRLHAAHEDFTQHLPRALSLYILSLLDPRSLCRAAQVSWRWHDLSEHGALWRRRCLQLGFQPQIMDNGDSSPGLAPPPTTRSLPHTARTTQAWTNDTQPSSAWTNGVQPLLAADHLQPVLPTPESPRWKHLYVLNVLHLRKTLPKGTDEDASETSTWRGTGRARALDTFRHKKPWRGPNKQPNDIDRPNYFVSSDPILKKGGHRCCPRRHHSSDRQHGTLSPMSSSRSLTVAGTVAFGGDSLKLSLADIDPADDCTAVQ